MLEELKKEVAEKEELIKIQLAREIQRLQEDKLKIEHNIQGTHLFFQVIPSFFLLHPNTSSVSFRRVLLYKIIVSRKL
jgi:hypothetical protein